MVGKSKRHRIGVGISYYWKLILEFNFLVFGFPSKELIPWVRGSSVCGRWSSVCGRWSSVCGRWGSVCGR